MKNYSLLFLTAFVWLFGSANAQTIEAEKASEISRKAKKGAVDEITFDPKANEYAVTYITSDKDLWKSRRIKWETYFFDGTTYELKRDEQGEDDYEKVRLKFPKFGKRFRGQDEYKFEALGVERNLIGTLVLRRKEISYEWSWFWGEYDIDVKLLDKLKPKTDDDAKFAYITHIEEDSTGQAVILAGAKGNKGGLGGLVATGKEYHVMRFNLALEKLADAEILFDEPQFVHKFYPIVKLKDDDSGETAQALGFDIIFKDAEAKKMTFVRVDSYGKVVSRVTSDFQFPQHIVFEGQTYKNVPGTDGGKRVIGIDILTAPADPSLGGWGGKSKEKDPNPKNYSYLRVNFDEGKIEAKGNFESPRVRIDVQKTYISNYEDAWYLYGTSTKTKEKYYNTTVPGKKTTDLHMIKIDQGKAAYVSDVPVASLALKYKSTPLMKKAPKIAGNAFKNDSYGITKDGQVLAAWQGYAVKTNKKTGLSTFSYKLPFLYHFDQKGEMKSVYTVKYAGAKAKAMGATQAIVENTGNENMYWYLQEFDGVKKAGKGKIKALLYPRIAKVDMGAGSLGEFIQPGKEGSKQVYFLDNTFPTVPSAPGKMVFFGADKSGKKVWFSRVGL